MAARMAKARRETSAKPQATARASALARVPQPAGPDHMLAVGRAAASCSLAFAQRSVLQLQRRYGNRRVVQALALAPAREQPVARVDGRVEHGVERMAV